MAHKIQIKRGNKADLPTLDVGEFGLCQDTNELFIGNNGNQKIFPPTAPTIPDATTSAAGLMSAADKTKLDGIETGANNYVHPTTAGNKHIPSGGSSGQLLGYSSSGTAKWVAPSTINAGQVDGKSIWVGAEGSRGTDANTIYFCY